MIKITFDNGEVYNEKQFKKDYVRMMDSLREDHTGEKNCVGVNCGVCPLLKTCGWEGEESPYYKCLETVKFVHNWAKTHPIITNEDMLKKTLGKDWELTEISDQVCYRLDLGNNRFLDIVGHCSGMGDASYDFGHCKMYYICNGISWRLKKDSNLDECMMIGNDIANRKLDDNAIITLCYDEIFKKKEETKRSKDADISIDVDALKKSIEVNGHTSKSIVAMEELAELSQAVSKAYRYIDNNETKMESGLNTADILDNMAEEIADVLICIANLKIMYGIKNEDINGWIDYKIRRQKIKDTKMKSK